MTEKDKRPELWYPTETVRREEADAWYDGPSGVSSYFPVSRAAEAEKRKKKQRRTKIIALCLSAVVLAGSVLSVVNSVRSIKRAGRSSSAAVSSDSEDRQERYQDYFAAYYTESNQVAIQSVKADAGVTLPLVSRAGHEALSLQEIYRRVNPAVVGVTTYKDRTEYSWGTGVIFRSDGYIITNTHIIQGADAAKVTLSTGRSFDAYLVGEDEQSDIAVLKIDGEDLPWAEFGLSDEMIVGDEVAAIGNPLGESYAGTMTNGIVSSIDRTVTNQGHRMTLLQTNAALNEGNSGGPLVNMYGQVIGITNMKIMSVFYSTVEGIGFAIPSSTVKDVADQLLSNGVVSGEPTIGITAGPVNDEAIVMYGLPAGVYVTEVKDGSGAQAGGLLTGDIITKVDGISVATVADINEIKSDRSVGDVLTLTVYREGRTFDLDVVLVDKADVVW